MAAVKCKLCTNCEKGFCLAKSSGGVHPHVALNKNRCCGEFKPSPKAYAHEADLIYLKDKIPRYAPTWRYYSTKKELEKAGELKGPLYVRLNPEVNS
jgi:hypothetical protein